MTFGELRHAAHKLVLKLDPEAARKRKEAARPDAHVRRFREDSGNAGMVARELPSDEVLASWQHVEQRALDLRAAGMPGTLQELRVRAYLDLLQERDSRDQPARYRPRPAASAAARPPPDSDHPACRPRRPRPAGGPATAPDPAPLPAPDPAPPPLPVPAQIPGRAWPRWSPSPSPGPPCQGHSDTPGEAGGFGLLDGDDARDLAAAAARHPRTRWCVTALNPDGTAAAHACLTGRHPPPGPAPPGSPPGSLNLTMVPVTRGPCGHAHAEVGYHPSRKLAHLIRARSATCTAPGCRRPAARCDLDHTHPLGPGRADLRV